jgi:Flp pilus assembly protein TadD
MTDTDRVSHRRAPWLDRCQLFLWCLILGTSAVSKEIGAHYVQARGVPAGQLLEIDVPVVDEISRRDYSLGIEAPITQWLRRHDAQDRILYIALTKDIPVRVAGTRGRTGSVSSVDSDLTLLYRKMVGAAGVSILETTTESASAAAELLGYYSWGSNDPSLVGRDLGLNFAAGSIASSYVGTSARTFTAPPTDWTTGQWRDRRSYYAGPPEWPSGDMIRQGATGGAGHVADPFLDGALRPQPLFSAYLNGCNLAESFYLALPDLGWRAVIVGDPLAAPFNRPGVPLDIASPTANPATGLPRFFSARHVARIEEEGLSVEAATLVARANRLLAIEDRTGATAALSEAQTHSELPQLYSVSLAQLHFEADNTARAKAQYQLILDRWPDNIAALNNLAVLLGEEANQLDEAFRRAQRAFVLSQGAPVVADTLDLIYHIRGEDQEALDHLTASAVGAPSSAETRLHLAVVQHAVGQLDASRTELQQALASDPDLDGTPIVETLRQQLGEAPGGNGR